MVRRLFILLLSSVVLTAFPTLAANVVSVGGGVGAPGEEVKISVSLATDAADVAAAEIRIPMPSGMTPVDGSCIKSGDRLASHSVSASLNGNDYVIVIFNTSLSAIPVGDGEVLRFRVTLGENPGQFALIPRVKLSDAAGNAVAATAKGENLTVAAPRLSLGSTAIDFGRIPIRNRHTQTVTATNTGTAELRIDRMDCSISELSAVPVKNVLAPGESTGIEIVYTPQEGAERAYGRVTAVSNSVGASPMVAVTANPYSVNKLGIADAKGRSDSQVIISVSLDNMEPVAGMEFNMYLPEGVEYVEGSVAPAVRAAGMSATAKVDSRHMLRVVLFSLSNTLVSGESGEVMTFGLRLACGSNTFTLRAQDVKLANTSGENVCSMLSSDQDTGAAYLTVEAPCLNASSQFDIGDVVLGGVADRTYEIYNSGNVPLIIERIVTDGGCAVPDAIFPIEIAAWSSASIPVRLEDPTFGNFSGRWLVYSNDPDNRMKAVTVCGNCYIPNELVFSGVVDGNRYTLTGNLNNTADITALQLDIVVPDGIAADTESLRLSDRAAGHSATVAEVDRGRYRIVIFSISNTPVTGDSGALFSLDFTGTGFAGKQFIIENIKLSSMDGKNYTTPSTDFQLETVPIEVESVVLSETELTIRIDATASLQATVLPDNATDKTVVWTSSNQDVASVDSYGNIIPHSVGTAEITATAGGVSATCHVTVRGIPAEYIWLSCNGYTMQHHDTFALTATVYPDNATDKTVVLSSSDESILTVDANGLVTAVGVGSAIITAISGEISATCEITVYPLEASSIELSHRSITIRNCGSFQLSATVYPENATDKTVTWSSYNPDWVSVDENGLVTAHCVCSTYVEARCGNVYQYCEVNVEPIAAESVVLSQIEITMRIGQSGTLTATVLPDDTTDKTVMWESSDTGVADVDSNGIVTAYAIGTATITATCGDASATCIVTVEPILAELLTLDITEKSAMPGESFRLTATVLPEDATAPGLVWESSNTNVAKVDNAGYVTVMGNGVCVIRVKTTDGSNLSAECVVTGLSGIEAVWIDEDTRADVYDLDGVRVLLEASLDDFRRLSPGIYIVNNRKILLH